MTRLPLFIPLAAAAALLGCGSDTGPEGSGGATSTNSTSSSSSSQSTSSSNVGGGGAAPTELLAVVDLPASGLVHGLSGTVYDASTHTLLAISDIVPRLMPLAVSPDFQTITPSTPIDLTGRPGTAWDGEALVQMGSEILAVTVETAPLLERFDGSGAYLGEVDVPAHYAAQAANNKGLESLTLSPSGAFLFTINESALTTDGSAATKAQGTTVRLLRRDLAASKDEERAYRTEPLGAGTGGDMGVSDLLAVGESTLLVLERGFQSDHGNTVRLFAVDFGASSDDVSAVASLDASTPVLPKTLVLDLATLPSEGVTHPSQQPNPILDNYEALALGPDLPDGRKVVFVTSDDNGNATQVARVLVLAVRLD